MNYARSQPGFAATPASVSAEPSAEGEIAIVRNWLESISLIDMHDVVADGGITAAMVVQQEAASMAARLRRAEPHDPAAELTKLRRHLELVGLCPLCAGSHPGRHPGACCGPPTPSTPPPHGMQG